MTKILIVDEDTDVLRLLRVKLTGAGYEVSLARDGKEALTLAEQGPPEVVVMELILPDIHGLELLTKLQAQMAPVPLVIVLTSEGAEEAIAKAFAAGAADYLTKPFSPQGLLERLRVNLIRAHIAAAGVKEQ